MRTFLHDASLIHDKDAMGLENGCQAMGIERRAPLHQPVERFLHKGLALGVERGGRLIQQQHRCVLEDGARDRDTLTLPARERDAPSPTCVS